MNNAFTILGAKPTDSAERLQELLEEKGLLWDDLNEVQDAYADLVNPQKRIRHEIRYFRSSVFAPFDRMLTVSEEDMPSLTNIVKTLVSVGAWFEEDDWELFDEINDARDVAQFKQIDDMDKMSEVVDEVKKDVVQSANAYFDSLEQTTTVRIFNGIVKEDCYSSFFVDELMAHYELIIKETLEDKEKLVNSTFDSIEKLCNQFNGGNELSTLLCVRVDELSDALKAWDRIVQPLQVNMQDRGGQHEYSGRMANGIRNKMVALCNSSQDVLKKFLDHFEQARLGAQLGFNSRYEMMNARNALEGRLKDSICFTNEIIRMTDVLLDVFAELEITVEQLKSDRKQLAELKEVLLKLRNQIPGAEQRASIADQRANSERLIQQASPSTDNETGGKRILLGVLAAISFVFMIVGFVRGLPAMGAAFIIVGLAFAVGCCAYNTLKENPKGVFAVIAIAVLLIFIIVVPLAVTSSNSYGKTYTVTFNREGGTGGTSSVDAKYNASMPYATKPTKSGYEFMGYYSGKNGTGVKYYDSDMSSTRQWDKESSSTLYAYWKAINRGIVLTADNFENYFVLTSSCSASTTSTGKLRVTYKYSISPKVGFNYTNSENPSSITVVIGLSISSVKQSYGTPSKYKITVHLSKSSGYSKSGSITYTVSSSEKYWSDGIYSVSGTIYN